LKPRFYRVTRALGTAVVVALVFAVLPGAVAVPADAAPVPAPGEVVSLQDCVAIAIDNHPALKSAGASVRAAEQRVWQSVSGYLPQVGGNYDFQRRSTSIGARTGTDAGGLTTTFNFHNAGLSFSQVLFDFGRNLAAIRAAQAFERSAVADLRTQLETVTFNVKSRYFDLLAAHRLLGVASTTVQQSQQQADEAEARAGVGLAPKFDVTRARTQLANAELDELTAGNAVAVARESLRNALGLTAPLDFDIADSLEVAPIAVDEAKVVDAAYANRSELQSLADQQVALEQEIKRLKRDYLPSINGGGAYYWTGTDYPLQDNWNIGASLNLSLFNGGLTTAQVGEAEANLAALQFNTESLRQNVALEVRQAVLDLRRAAASISVAEKGVQQARESLDLAQGRYRTGVGNIIEITDAQTALTSAEASHVQALYGYRTALATLERAVGRPLTAEDA